MDNETTEKLKGIATLIATKGMTGIVETFSSDSEREMKQMQRIQDNMKKSGKAVPIPMKPAK